MSRSVKLARKVGVALVGFPVIVAGVAMLVLPGPGLLVILLGLLIISWEFDWAKRYVDKVRAQLDKVAEAARRDKTDKNPKD